MTAHGAADPIVDRFARRFGGPPDLVVRSPGRVNLIGEHTDYNDGFALPAALDLATDVAARRRDDGRLRTVAVNIAAPGPAGLPAEDVAAADDLRPTSGPHWTRYVRGSAALVAAEGWDVAADLMIDSRVPVGSGLSSSASLELGVAVALLSLAGGTMPAMALARLGQRVENEIVGVSTGIMDQLAVGCGVAGHAILVDCRAGSVEPVPIPAGVRVLVLDSAVPRGLAGSVYNERRADCETAVAALQAVAPEVRALRDVTPDLLAAERGRLSDVQYRRARHVVGEDRRVLAGVDALRAGDAAGFGLLMGESQVSLRDDYEVSGPELDTLVSIAAGTDGVLGARLTGAGFGGCAVALVTAAQADQAAAGITAAYRSATGRAGSAWVCTPSAGTHVRWRRDA